ncbi:MAG: tetratricopeptide repeat protein [Magnetococcales bacterium]|nr:tetratricopeptide repeat protein [Magnetococcales bacterium]MBF0150261.1 tetratricopeptide repeat protein [Magnetococcales bacterium]MBF0172157.1 tetratricopeptide repeat protein [Magnetococcales bacterium]MBF0630543.1 tetratricopeptide repeat protein [Magnetococcales bacterium]
MTRSIIVFFAITGWLITWHAPNALAASTPKNNQAWSTTADFFKQSYAFEARSKFAEAAEVLLPLQDTRGSDRELILLRLGWLHYLQGRHNDAIHFYQLAIRTNSRSIDAMLGITLPLLAQQRYREAAAFAESVLTLSHVNQTALQRLLVADEGQKLWDSLLAHAMTLSTHYPTDTDALVYMARAHLWLNHPKEARDVYQRVLNRIPNHIEATAYLKTHP